MSLVSPRTVSAPTPGQESPYRVTSWDLSELLPEPTEEVLSGAIADLQAAADAFEATRERLGPEMAPSTMLEVLRQYERLDELLTVLGGYASLWFASDTQSSAALSFRNRMQELLTRIENRTLFFTLWWKGLEEPQATRLLQAATGEPDFRHFLQDLRRFRPYTLDERSEQLINLKDANGIHGMITLYSMLTNRLEFKVELDGEVRSLTDGELRSLFYHPSADVRARVYREKLAVYAREAPVLAQIYANRVRDWHTEFVELRRFRSPVSVRNVSNDIPDAAVETLLEVVHRNASIFHDYFRLKAKWLGVPKLARYDLYAPLASSDRTVPYAEAVAEILDTFRGFDRRFGDLAERVFAERHIDSEIRKGKKSGAFCSTLLPRLTPWILINYTGRVRDVATLAHELGHAVHSMLAGDHSVLTQHASLPLAETASVFAEMLMTDRLLSQEEDPLARRELLGAAVDDIYATVLRQAFFVRFELEAHEAILANKSADDLFDLYLRNLEEQFGDSLEIGPAFRFEWVGIPHVYHTPFYCYAYSFGQLLVLSLYRRYQEQGEAFKPGYLELLACGGSARPTEMLSGIGIDITDPAFWEGGFDVVRGLIDELKSIDV